MAGGGSVYSRFHSASIGLSLGLAPISFAFDRSGPTPKDLWPLNKASPSSVRLKEYHPARMA